MPRARESAGMANNDLKPFDGPLDQQQSASLKPFDGKLDGDEPPARGFGGWARDIAATAVKGAIAVPEAVVGLADIPTGGRVGKFLENEGGAFGFRPKQAREAVSEWHSDATKAAQQKFQEAEGFGGKFKAAIENPSVVASAIGESIPSMAAGGVAARGLMAATRLGQMGAGGAALAGAAGEGAMMAGSQAANIRQETEDGLLTPTQAGLAAATGVVGGALGAVGGKVAQRLGVGDVDTMIAQGATGSQAQQAALKSIPKQVIQGAMAEGLLEELPQSVSEQILQNMALGKDWSEGVDAAAVMGVLSGGAMGGAAAGVQGFANSRRPAEQAPQEQPAVTPTSQEPTAPQSAEPAPRLGFNPLAGTPTIYPDGSVALNGEQEFQYRTGSVAPQKRSEQMGLNPSAGPMSSAAALAVDTGASDQVQEQAALAMAAEEKTGKPAVSEPVPLEQRSLDELRQAFRSAQDPGIRQKLAAEIRKRREAMPDPLSQPQQEVALEPQTPEAVQSQPQEAPPAPLGQPLTDAGTNILGRGTDPLQPIIQSQADASRAAVKPPRGILAKKAAADAKRKKANEQAAQPAATSAETAADPAPAVRGTGVSGGDQPQPLDTLSNVQEQPQGTNVGGAAAKPVNREQAIRDAWRKEPRTIGKWTPISVEAEGQKADMLINQKRAGGDKDGALHVVNIRMGKMLKDMEREPIAYTFRLTADNRLVEEGIPTVATPGQIAAWKGAGFALDDKQANVQDAPQGTEDQAAAAPVEAPAPAGGNAGAADGVPDTRAGEGVRKDGVGKKQVFNIGGRDPHTATFEHKDDGRLIRTITYPDGQASTETLVTNRNGDESWVSQSSYEKGEFYPVQLSEAEAGTAIRDDIAGKPVKPAAPGAGDVQADGVKIAEAANQAATSPKNDLPQPTEAQKDAGNYVKGHVTINGLGISIENPAGSKRRPEWPALKNHYGYFKGSVGADKDHVDVFMTDRAGDESLPVFVVDQVNKDGTFDEHKVVMGAADEAEARATYLQNYEKGWTGLGAITQMSLDDFKAWVRDPAKTKKPVALKRGVIAKMAEQKAKKAPFAKKEDVEHLFGIDQKRRAALDRIAKGTAYFGTKAKADEFITKSGIGDTHEVVQAKAGRFDIRAKGVSGMQTADAAPAAASPPETTVVVPPTVDDALTGQMEKQKARIARTKRDADQPGMTLDEKKQAQTKVLAAESTLRKMRTTRFDAEDAAVKAVETRDIKAFAEHEMLFPDANKAIQQLLGLNDELDSEMQAYERKADEKPKGIVGRRTDGVMIREDENGVRYYTDGGVRISETVTMRPTRQGVQVSRGELKPEFMTSEELAASKTEQAPAVGLQTSVAERELAAKAQAAALTEKEKAAKAKMLGAAAKLADLLSKNTRANITPEQEQKMLPIVIELFEGAMDLGYVKFKQAARYVREFIAGAIDQDAADAIPIDTLQGAYIATARRHADKDITPKKDVISVESIADLEEPAESADTGAPKDGNATQQLDRTGTGALGGAPTQDVRAPDGERDAGAGADRGGRGDGAGNARADDAGGNAGRGLGGDAGAVSVPGRGTRAGAADAKKPRVSRTRRADPGDGLFGPAGGLTPEVGANPAPNAPAIPAPQPAAQDFTITDELSLGEGGQKTKFRNNVAAIRLVRDLEATGRMATPEEQAVLAKYVGWGGLPQAFDPNNADWAREHAELTELMSPEDLADARKSTRYAHYTSREIIVDGIYAAMRRFGFTGGKTLEAGAGVGNFIGLMPADMRSAGRFTAIEREPFSSAIARNLYPQQSVQRADFTEFKGTDAYYDAAVGNPPFASDPQTDRSGRKHLSGLSLHNYFFAKAIDMLREGGIMAQVVTNSFLDAKGDRARKYISDRAEFLGAIRLPNNAFSKNAGTEVTTDIILLKKRPDSEVGGKAARADAKRWLDIGTYTDKNGKQVALNQYFIDNPDMMLGEFGAFGTMYGPDNPALVARQGQDTMALLKAAVERLPAGVYKSIAETGTANQINAAVVALKNPSVKEGGYFLDGDKLMQRIEDIAGEARGIEITPATQWTAKTVLGDAGYDRIKRLAGMRSTVRSLLAAEMADDTKAMETLRATLNQQYDAYRDTHGLINDLGTLRVFDDDPDYPLLASLEHGYTPGISVVVAKRMGVKPTKATAKKGPIFTQRVVAARQAVQKVETPADALAVSMAERGKLDAAYIGQLLGMDPDAVLKELSTGDKPLLFLDPATDEYVLRDAYLSGNVRAKLAQAREAGMFQNVAELEAVQPEDVGSHEITARLGSPWVPTDIYRDFAKHLYGEDARAVVVYLPANSSYQVFVSNGSEVAMTNTWGTNAYPGDALLQAVMNNRSVKVTYRDSEGKTHTDIKATEEANEKAQQIKEKFNDWLFADPERSEILTKAYNETNNNYVTRVYDGGHMTFPGKVPDSVIKFRRHQRNAIARIVQDRTALLDHVVGAGKTFTVISGAMELKRTGLARKPMVVVPNHLVKQWAADFYRLYPGANVLTATKKDFEKGNRRKFLAKIATGDWDAVVIAHSSFGFIKPAPEFEAEFNGREIQKIMATIQNVEDSDGEKQTKKRTIKQLEGMKERLENRIRQLRDKPMDDLLDFEQIGVDQLFVDEAHLFKNLMYTTKMQGVAGLNDPTGSQRAYDMYVKTNQVMEKNGRGQGVVFATGTPVSNSLAEMYHMMRYLMPNQMRELGFDSFDAWANTYASVEQVWMQAPSGDGFKAQNRMSNFVNTPELLKMFDQVSDTVTMDDIKRAYAEENDGAEFPLPKLKGGRRTPVSLIKSPAQNAYMDEIAKRAKAVEQRKGPPQKGDDNILVIMSDARKAAMDIRLVDPDVTTREPGGRIDRATDAVMERYQKYNSVKGTQLVFSDLGTPLKHAKKELAEYEALQARIQGANADVAASAALGNESAMETLEDAEAAQAELDAMGPDWLSAVKAALRGFSIYDDFKAALVEKGIPEEEIAFIHDYNTDDQKASLFRKVNSGQIRVLLGSTAKLGAGTNVQERLVAEHHLDVPWRPSDVEQREGRIERQGNRLMTEWPNFEIEILAYVTQDTLDMRMWQVQETKLKMINQLRTRKIGREIDNAFEDMELSAGEMQAAATGDINLLKEIQLRNDVKKLEQRRRAFDGQRNDLISRKRRNAEALRDLPAKVAESKAEADVVRQYREDVVNSRPAFRMNIDGKDYTDAAEAQGVLRALDEATEEVTDLAGEVKTKKKPLSVTIDGELIKNRATMAELYSNATGDKDPIAWTYNGETYRRRTVLANAIRAKVQDAIADDSLQQVGTIGAYSVAVEGNGGDVLEVTLSRGGDVKMSNTMTASDTGRAADKVVTLVENLMSSALTEAGWLERSLERAKKDADELSKVDVGGDWPDQAKLDAARAAHKEVLANLKKKEEAAAPAAEDEGDANFGTRERGTGTPIDRAVMSMAGDGKSGNDILQFIANASRSPYRRQLAKKLLATGANPAVSLGGDMGGGQGFKFLAKYSRKNHEVTLSEAAADRAEQIFLHETTHAATLLALDKGGLFAAQMNRLYESAKKQGGADGQYGMKNVGEFVAEAFTNPTFQSALKGMKAETGSLWDRFVRMVRRVLGLPDRQQDMLSAALDLGAKVMRENMPLRAAQSFRAEDGPEFAGIDQTETPEFKRWFAGSKVVDAAGKPLVVYHGTRGDFSSFYVPHPEGKQRFYFAADPAVASEYTNDHTGRPGSGANMMPAFVALKNPAIVDGGGANFTGIDLSGVPDQLRASLPSEVVRRGYASLSSLASAAEAQGFDGVVARNVRDGAGPYGEQNPGDVFVAFRPEQIKSATGNRGTFDPNDPDIAHFGIADAVEQIGKQAAVKPVVQALNDTFKVRGKLHWWHKTVGTPFNLAERVPEFKRVFNAVQDFINSVSFYGAEAAAMAPKIIPKLESWKDFGKSPIKAEDNKAIAAPIFEGTLSWMRDESGRPVKVADMQAAADLLSADEKAQRLLRARKINPQVLAMWRGLPLEQFQANINARYTSEMLTPGVVWKDSELRSMFKLTDEQIGLYKEFRAATDKSLTDLAMSDILQLAGKDADPIKEQVMGMSLEEGSETVRDYLMSLAESDPDRRESLMDTANAAIDKANKVQTLMDRGYAPLQRFGRYTVYAKDADGEQLFFGMYEDRWSAARAARQMREQYPEASVETGMMSQEAYKLFQGISPETLEIFGTMLGMDSQADGETNKAFQTYLKLAKSNRSALKRLIERKGISGYSEDASRVLASFIYSNARQTASNLHVGEIMNGVNDIPRDMGDAKDAAMRLARYTMDPQEEAQAIRGLLFAQYLGGSIASAAINALQPAQVTFPYLSQFVGAKKSAVLMKDAVRDALKKKTGDERLDAELKKAEEEGIVSPQEIFQLMAQAQGKATLRAGDGTKAGDAAALASNTLSRVSLGWGKVFSIPEQFNRRTTFIAAYRTALETGEANPYDFAKQAVKETQLVYNKGNRPEWARGAIGALAFTFKTYSISYVELLQRMATSGPEGRRAAMLMLGVLFLMAGAGGAPGVEDLEDVVDGIAQRVFGLNFQSRQKRQEWLAETFGDGAARFIENGVSGLPWSPTDVSGRLGLGNLIPGTGLFVKKENYGRDVAEIAGPAADMTKRFLEGAGLLLQGEVLKAGEIVSPVAVRNMIQGGRMLATDQYTDTKGRKVIDTTTAEGITKMIGFQPADVARVQEATGTTQRMIVLNKIRESEIADKWAKGLASGDADLVQEARDDLARWNKANPESQIRIKIPQIMRRVRALKEDKATRIARTAPAEIRQDVRRALEQGQ